MEVRRRALLPDPRVKRTRQRGRHQRGHGAAQHRFEAQRGDGRALARGDAAGSAELDADRREIREAEECVAGPLYERITEVA